MTTDEEKQMEALFAAGDPAARLPELLPQRVAARLAESSDRRAAGGFSWARSLALGVVLVSSVGMGAAAVWATVEARKSPVIHLPAPAPSLARPAPKTVAPREADPISLEAALLQASLEALQRGEAEDALAKLAEREERFPGGPLASEAAVARARALLLAHRDDEALAAFAALPEQDLTVALRLTWAELLVKTGRCGPALAMLKQVEGEARVVASLRSRCGR